MSEQSGNEPAAAKPLQFDKVEYAEPTAGNKCALCGQEISGSFYTVNDSLVCSVCHNTRLATLTGGSGIGRFVRAVLFGCVAAVLGAAIYFAILFTTRIEFGLVAIVVGLMVGGAVRAGCRHRGGLLYQFLAMFLTYTAIVSTYVPFVFRGVNRPAEQQKGGDQKNPGKAADVKVAEKPAPADEKLKHPGLEAWIRLIALIYAVPFLAGADNIIGLIIIGIALYEAWKMNARHPLVISGPHHGPVHPAAPTV